MEGGVGESARGMGGGWERVGMDRWSRRPAAPGAPRTAGGDGRGCGGHEQIIAERRSIIVQLVDTFTEEL
jgi:hypothetical protein